MKKISSSDLGQLLNKEQMRKIIGGYFGCVNLRQCVMYDAGDLPTFGTCGYHRGFADCFCDALGADYGQTSGYAHQVCETID